MQFASRASLALATLLTAMCWSTQTPDQAAVLYRRSVGRDLTGDNTPETLTVVAQGRSLDSASVTLTIRGMGRELFRDSWDTSDQFVEERTLAAQPPSRDSLSRMARRRLDDLFSEEAFDHSIELQGPWSPVTSDYEGDARGCIAFYLRFERDTAARVRRGLPPTPPAGPEYADFIERIDAAPFDTAFVRRIGADMRTRRVLAFTFSYGYE